MIPRARTAFFAVVLAVAVPAPAVEAARKGQKHAEHHAGWKAKRLVRAPRPVVPAPAPKPARSSATLTLDRTSAARGERFTMTVRNTGTTTLTYGADYHFERWRDGRWERTGDPRPVPAWAAAVEPGQSGVVDGFVWEELEPGPHRIVKSLSDPDGQVVTVAAELEVR